MSSHWQLAKLHQKPLPAFIMLHLWTADFRMTSFMDIDEMFRKLKKIKITLQKVRIITKLILVWILYLIRFLSVFRIRFTNTSFDIRLKSFPMMMTLFIKSTRTKQRIFLRFWGINLRCKDFNLSLKDLHSF